MYFIVRNCNERKMKNYCSCIFFLTFLFLFAFKILLFAKGSIARRFLFSTKLFLCRVKIFHLKNSRWMTTHRLRVIRKLIKQEMEILNYIMQNSKLLEIIFWFLFLILFLVLMCIVSEFFQIYIQYFYGAFIWIVRFLLLNTLQ